MMKSVSDLKNWLESNNLSPEQFAKRVKISNMTIRRLLTKPPESPIPDKYRIQLESSCWGTVTTDHSLEALMRPDYKPASLHDHEFLLETLQSSGSNFKQDQLPKLRSELNEKAKDERVGPIFRSRLDNVISFAFEGSDSKLKCLAIGALLYFINPMDMIPDLMGPLGLIDDMGILCICVSYIQSKRS